MIKNKVCLQTRKEVRALDLHLHLSPEAREKLASAAKPGTVVRLVYDSEGCGCAVSGVPQLWLIPERDAKGLVSAVDEKPAVVYDPRQAVFFEPQLKLDYNADQNSFRLAGDGQIYHYGMTLIDKSERKMMI